MNSSIIFFAVCLVFACAVTAQEQKTLKSVNPSADHAPVEPAQNGRNKRFFPYAYGAAVSPVITSGYSYLAAYPNSGKIVHYPAPVYSAAYPAAYAAPHIIY